MFHINRKIPFIVIDAGQEAGIGPGMRFEILSPDGKTVRATAQFEKYVDSYRLFSKLVVLQGSAAEVMPDDLAATRDAPVSPPAEGK